MQDIHYLTRVGHPSERLFAAAAARDRRRLHQTNQAIKCPRCDSLDTKFCYYNNYNLSQPRHFCKSCRRYWTKGGVLRNVPVGGGSRKSKRSSSGSSSSAAKSLNRDDAVIVVTNNNINNSSDDSSAIAAATSPVIPADISTLFHEYDSSCMEKPATTSSSSSLYGIEDIGIDHHHGGGRDDESAGMLTEIRNFPSLIESTAEIGTFGYGALMSQQDHQQQQPQDSVVVEGFGPLDWEGRGVDINGEVRGGELFDVTGAVDHAYWSQPNQWDCGR